MENIFLHLVNMSITAGWIALAVIILRLFLKKAPKWITVLLWGLVGLRLILPISIESRLSLIPDFSPINSGIIETIPDTNESLNPQNNSISITPEENESEGQQNIHNNTENILTPPVTENTAKATKPDLITIFSYIWLGGTAGMFIYSGISYLKIRKKVAVSFPIENNIRICDNINTPFILGVIKPKVYLPSDLSGSDAEYVISHEKAHIKRKDHLIKPLGFLLLSVYWFNPLLWIAYVLLCRDIEFACDEKVIKDMGVESRKEYSTALLNCSVPRRMISACPLAFGEVSVKQRIKSVLNYKKPAFWISIVAIILCIALSIGFLTNPEARNGFRIKISDKGTDIDGITLDYVTSDFAEDNNSMPFIRLKWKNTTDNTYKIRESFTIFKNVNGEWKDTRIGYHNYLDATYRLTPDESYTREYNLWHYNIDESGTYRLESYFYQSYGDSDYTERTAWIEFKINNPPDTDKSIFTSSVPKTQQLNSKIHGSIEYLHQADNDKDGVLDDGSVIIIDWFNQSGMTLTTASKNFSLYNSSTNTHLNAEDNKSSDTSEVTLPADKITRIAYPLSGLQKLSSGKYRLTAELSSGYKTYNADIEFDIGNETSASAPTEEACITYQCKDSEELVKPQLLLNPYIRTFLLKLSELYDKEYYGKYYIEDNVVTFQVGSNLYYKFKITEKKQLEFIESESSKLPKYQYSAKLNYSPPFKDGTVFEGDLSNAPEDFLSEEVKPISFAEAVSYSNANFTSSDAELSFSSSKDSSTFQLSNSHKNSVEKVYNTLKDSMLTFTYENPIPNSVYSIYLSGVDISIYSNDYISIFYSSTHSGRVTFFSEGITEKLHTCYKEILEEYGKIYSLKYTDQQYHCVIKAIDGTVLYDAFQRRTPHIKMVDENLLFKWEQNGTGTLTRSGQFYDLETKQVYGPFTGLVDYCNGLVCNSGNGKVFIRDLYDEAKVQVIDEFEYPVADFIETISYAQFTDDGKKIKIRYWSGENAHTERIEIFNVELS